ncbi:MAG TPA: ABC transporter permease, partial [Gammaproteobacteria bacterium]|nr:ABC transporter permease [Gammaproteobacteria bacterium]
GANSAVFSAIDAILLQPLGFPDADRLVVVNQSIPNAPVSNTAPVRIEEWNEQSTAFAAITGYYREDVSETSGDLPEKYRRAHVAPRFLDVWRTKPLIGRAFTPADNQAGAAPVALISHRYWTTKLESDPNVLERTVRIGEQAIPIVGVMPPSFRFPDRDVDIFTPLAYEPYVLNRRNLWMRGYGRLEPGVSIEQARADLELVQGRLTQQYPETDRDTGVYVEQLKETTVGAVRGSLWLLFGAVSLLLLIASTNIAALLLARAAKRSQEISVRLSLGASSASIRSQILVETALLAVVGALLGLLVAAGAAGALRRLTPDFPRIEELRLDGGILLYTLGAIVAVTLICGLLPAVRAARVSLSGALTDARRTQVSGRHSLQWVFVGIQVALSVVLLAGAGLLIRSFHELSRVDPGFEASRVLSFRIGGTFADFGGLADNVGRILDELGALPGVEATAVSSPVPGMIDDGSGFQFGIASLTIDGRDATQQDPARAQIRVVSPSYFATMQIPLLGGDLCRVIPPNTPDTPVEVMINAAFATRYLGSVSAAVGAIVRPAPNVALRVAGVVGDAREFALDRAPVPSYYPCRLAYATPALAFLVRSRGDPANVTDVVRAKVKELEPLRAVYDVAPLAERIGNEHAQDRLRTSALALFAGTALALACLGVYGTLSYVVSLRRREVGLRVALGAQPGNIVAQFLSKALRVVAVAAAAGLVLSLVFARALAGMLFGVSPFDAVTFGGVVALVTSVAIVAALVPAVRAARVDPMTVLRDE